MRRGLGTSRYKGGCPCGCRWRLATRFFLATQVVALIYGLYAYTITWIICLRELLDFRPLGRNTHSPFQHCHMHCRP